MLLDMLIRHSVTLFLILLFGLKLLSRKTFRNSATGYFWLTVISCLLLVLEDSFEVVASTDPSLRFLRTLLSVLGYTLRSTAVLGLLLVIVRQKKRRILLWIPSLVTFLVCGTAFFSDIAFGFDQEYRFYRGPLGYIAFIVPIGYLLLLLVLTFRKVTEKNGVERVIAMGCGIFCLAACFMDTFYGGIRLNEAIMISSVFFYMILYSNDNRRDPMTGLLNRKAFYDDCNSLNKNIGAAMSVDMNGLKTLNDTFGHQAGDEALIRIGECLKAATDRDTRAYRIGGDEFVLLFLHDREEPIARAEQQIRESVADDGYSVSTGFAVRARNEELTETIKKSDSRMYEDKENYYSQHANDRRRK